MIMMIIIRRTIITNNDIGDSGNDYYNDNSNDNLNKELTSQSDIL